MEKIRYLSLFSGIEAFSCAVKGMPEFEPVAFAEIEPFPCAVLAHHYPDVPNLGDVTKIDGRKYRGLVDLIVGGSPCQGFSVAGQRKGLDDERSCLALTFVRLVDEVRPKWFLWENVPGAFSTNGGQDIRSFCAALNDLNYSLAGTVLDSQYFGVAQRRRRVFLVGFLGTDWERPAKVLLEPESMCGNPPPRRKARQGDTGAAEGGSGERGEQGGFITPEPDGGCATISAKWSKQAGGYAGDEYHNLVGEAGPADSVRQPNKVAPAVTASGSAYAHPGQHGSEVDALVLDEPKQNPTFATICASGAGCDRPSAQGSQLDYCVVDKAKPKEKAYQVCNGEAHLTDVSCTLGTDCRYGAGQQLTGMAIVDKQPDRDMCVDASGNREPRVYFKAVPTIQANLDHRQRLGVFDEKPERDICVDGGGQHEARIYEETAPTLQSRLGQKQLLGVLDEQPEAYQIDKTKAKKVDVSCTLDVGCRNGAMQEQAGMAIIEPQKKRP